MAKFRFVQSCDLDVDVTVKITNLEGSLPRLGYQDLLEDPALQFCGRNQAKFPDLRVEIGLNSPGEVKVATAYKSFSDLGRWEWNEWLRLPGLKYSDLAVDAELDVAVFDCSCGQPSKVGGAKLALFEEEDAVFRAGAVDIRLNKADDDIEDDEKLQRFARVGKKYRESGKSCPDWLDRLTFAEVERVNAKEKRASNALFLGLEFVRFHVNEEPVAVVYFERNARVKNEMPSLTSDVIRCPDFDIHHDNIVEAKHHRLARSQRAGQRDRDLKPNAEIRNRLDEILKYPSVQSLSSEEADYVWRYRYFLSNNEKAVCKFVRCVNWRSKREAEPALELIEKWAPMNPEDALELLGPSFPHAGVRQYAVERLRHASDRDLQLYLLQLVQALKYEKVNDAWLLRKPQNDEDSMEASLPPTTMTIEKSLTESELLKEVDLASPLSSNGGLAAFLIERACQNSTIANYLYWYLMIECEDATETSSGASSSPSSTAPNIVGESHKTREMFGHVFRRFKDALRVSADPEVRERGHFLERQHHFVDKLVLLVRAVHRESGNRQKKIERLQALLRATPTNPTTADATFKFSKFDALQLPLDPEVLVCGVVPKKATLFKSSLMPARLTFKTVTGSDYVTLFKHGDDLRQDQLILQIITLMDRILQQENLDLKLTPYRVLATSSKHGFVQFVDSMPIADILANDGTILNFFRKHNAPEAMADVMDTYIKSCAGYCVITFILGVGDRHLDNLLIARSGNLFHIDFGYILGRDPKVLPPPMKLSKEMIDAFGGTSSEHYQAFKKECYTAYLSLRRYANLILNLFSLMVDASVPDIALEPDKTVKKVQEKFRLDLNDEEAVHYMQSVIEISAMAVMPAIVDRMHKLAQFLRN